MKSNLATNYLPIFSDEKKIEVSVVDGQAIIKLSTWTDDLGWCGQKTLSVDSEMLSELHRVIASARYKLKSEKDSKNSSNVLAFPSYS